MPTSILDRVDGLLHVEAVAEPSVAGQQPAIRRCPKPCQGLPDLIRPAAVSEVHDGILGEEPLAVPPVDERQLPLRADSTRDRGHHGPARIVIGAQESLSDAPRDHPQEPGGAARVNEAATARSPRQPANKPGDDRRSRIVAAADDAATTGLIPFLHEGGIGQIAGAIVFLVLADVLARVARRRLQ